MSFQMICYAGCASLFFFLIFVIFFCDELLDDDVLSVRAELLLRYFKLLCSDINHGEGNDGIRISHQLIAKYMKLTSTLDVLNIFPYG